MGTMMLGNVATIPTANQRSRRERCLIHNSVSARMLTDNITPGSEDCLTKFALTRDLRFALSALIYINATSQ